MKHLLKFVTMVLLLTNISTHADESSICTRLMKDKFKYESKIMQFNKVLKCVGFEHSKFRKGGMFGVEYTHDKKITASANNLKSQQMCIGITDNAVVYAGQTPVTRWAEKNDSWGKGRFRELIQGVEKKSFIAPDRDPALTECGVFKHCQRFSTNNTNNIEINSNSYEIDKKANAYCGYSLPGYGTDLDYSNRFTEWLKIYSNNIALLIRTQEYRSIEIPLSNTFNSSGYEQVYSCRVE